MKNILKNPAIYAILAYCILYLTAVYTFGNDTVKSIVDLVMLGVALIFFWKWFPNSLEAFRSGGAERKFRLSLGLALTAAGIAAQRIWVILVGNVELADWINIDAVNSFIGSWFIGAMLLCLSVDSPEDGLIPHLKWYYTTIILSFGIVIGFLLARIIFP